MNRTALLLAALLCVAAIPAVGGAYASTPTVDAACSDVEDSNVVVGVLSDTTLETTSGNPTLYPGTELSVAVCSRNQPEPRGSAWTLLDVDGLERVNETSDSVRVRVTDDAESVRVDAGVVEGKTENDLRAMSFDVVQPATAEVRALDNESVAFGSAEDVQAYEANRTDFWSTYDELQADVEHLESAAERVRSGGEPLATDAAVLDDEHWAPLVSPRQTLTANLLEEAARTNNPALADAARTVEGDSGDLRERAGVAVADYRDALAAERSSAVSNARVTFGVTLTAGVVFGVALGVVVPRREMRREQYDKSFTTVDYSSRVLLWPLGAAFVVFVGTLGFLVAQGALHQLFTVIL